MRISWVHFGAIQGDTQRRSELASARYRALIPARQLENLGHQISFIDLRTPISNMNSPRDFAEVYVFTKLMGPKTSDKLRLLAERTLQFAQTIRTAGSRVVSDHCDDHFGNSLFGPYYQELIRLSDGVVASTQSLADIIRNQTDRESVLISDPVEGVKQQPLFNPPRTRSLLQKLFGRGRFPEAVAGYTRPLQLLWYGHPSNLDTLESFLPELSRLSRQLPLHLQIMTSAGKGAEILCQRHSHGPRSVLSIDFCPWTAEAMWLALAHSDIVILPSNTANQKKLVKSPNRLLEALWAGRFAVADPVPSYRELEQWAWLSGDLATGIRWAVANPAEVVCRIGQAQEYIARHHTPAAIADRWLSLFKQVVKPINISSL